MASPTERPDPERGLGARPRMRLFAIAVWCAFLGGVLILGALLTLTPIDASLGELSLAFLVGWALTLVPVGFALVLARRNGHGR